MFEATWGQASAGPGRWMRKRRNQRAGRWPGRSGAKAGAGWDSSHLSVGAENQVSASELSLDALNSP